MGRRLAFAVGILTVVPTWFAAFGDEVQIPQNPEARQKRVRESLAWNEKTLVGAYNQRGQKDPRWDGLARSALGTLARYLSNRADRPVSLDEVGAAFKKAVDAGCDDPLIVFNNVRLNVLKSDESTDTTVAEAVEKLSKSSYPSVRKATALYLLAAQKSVRAKKDPKLVRECVDQNDQALDLVSRSFTEDGAGTPLENVWIENLRTKATPMLRDALGSMKPAYDHIDAKLAKAPAAKVVRLIHRGIFYKEYAWEARGVGFANTVNDENWKKFHDRLQEASVALQEAWEINPEHILIPMAMLDVALGLGTGREDMEQWFKRAMTLDSDSSYPCAQKLEWLSPRWYGSDEEAIAFGRACRDTKNYFAGIPLLLASAHFDVCDRLPEIEMRAYLSRDDVWSDVQSVYSETLKRFPKNNTNRTRYAGLAFLSKRYDEAAKQFRLIGDGLVPDRNFSEEFLKRAREESYAKEGQATR